jgi:hypothetical protein
MAPHDEEGIKMPATAAQSRFPPVMQKKGARDVQGTYQNEGWRETPRSHPRQLPKRIPPPPLPKRRNAGTTGFEMQRNENLMRKYEHMKRRVDKMLIHIAKSKCAIEKTKKVKDLFETLRQLAKT